MAEEMYCGIQAVPKGKIRGTPEYCLQNNQVRYYGLRKIKPEVIEKLEKSKVDLNKEILKLRKIESDAKILINESKKLKIIIEAKTATSTEKKNAKKRLETLRERRDRLVKRLNKQKAVVVAAEKEEARRKEEEAAEKKKAKAKKKSGSKTTKKSTKKSGSKSTKKKSTKKK